MGMREPPHSSRNHVMAGETVKQCGMARNGCYWVCGGGKHGSTSYEVKGFNCRTNQETVNGARQNERDDNRSKTQSNQANGCDGKTQPFDKCVDDSHALLPRLCGLLGCLAGLGGELGPDALPVIGAQLLASDHTFGSLLNLDASLYWDGAFAPRPFADGRLLDAQGFGHLRLASECFDCFLNRVHNASIGITDTKSKCIAYDRHRLFKSRHAYRH